MSVLVQKMFEVMMNRFFTESTIVYIIESADWSIRWDGRQITEQINRSSGSRATVRLTPIGLKNKLIHLGSWGTYLASARLAKIHPSNRIILTIFHLAGQIEPSDVRIINKRVSVIHTSSMITRRRLIEIGIPLEKIIVIPLGVDLKLFTAINRGQRTKIRMKLGLPDDRIIIGSFQKDGVGWGKGNEPKLIKGPDVFIQVVAELAKQFPIHVVLTGPARGYITAGLEKIRVPYTHHYLKNYWDIVSHYQALDLYLVTARNEGGPKAILEAGATSIPVVTTAVGMAPELIRNGENGFIAQIDDTKGLTRYCLSLLAQTDLRRQVASVLHADVQAYDWSKIAKRYYLEIYKPLLT